MQVALAVVLAAVQLLVGVAKVAISTMFLARKSEHTFLVRVLFVVVVVCRDVSVLVFSISYHGDEVVVVEIVHYKTDMDLRDGYYVESLKIVAINI